MNNESKSAIQWALKQFGNQTALARRKTYRDYYNGKHQLNFATDKFLTTFGQMFQALTENLCPIAVDPLVDLLQVETFLVTNVKGKKAQKDIQNEIAEILRLNRMEARFPVIHREALIAEETYIIVWPDAEDETIPIIYPNPAGQVVAKSHSRKLGYFTLAAKYWIEDGYIRLTIYFRDRLEKYRSRVKQTWLPSTATAFEPFYEPEDNEPWPLPNPFDKIPVFKITNDPDMNGEGKSELRDVIPPQNALNKSWCDMMVSSEFESFAQRYVVGFTPEKDRNGNDVNPTRAGPGNLWIFKKGDAKPGEFSRGDIAKFIEVQDSERGAIARISGVPLHYIGLGTSGDWPSGEALRTACERLTKKALNRMAVFGMVWADVIRFALEIRGRKNLTIETKWRDPAPRQGDAESWGVALQQQQAGVSVEQTLLERGYSAEQIAGFMDASVPTEELPLSDD